MDDFLFKRFIAVRDNFYQQGHKVYEIAKGSEFYQPEHCTGYRSTSVYHEPGVKSRLEKLLGVRITRWDIDPVEENGVFYFGLSKGNKREHPGVHSDWPHDDITCLIYLTPNLPFNCGTSLWKHKKTGLSSAPTSKDARRLKTKLKDLITQLDEDTNDRSKWEEIDRIGNVFNRLVAYPSGVFHSATKHFGSNTNNGRLYQTFRIGVDWSTFKL